MTPGVVRGMTEAVRKLLIVICVLLIVFPIYWMILTSIRPLDESIAVPPRVLPDPATVTLKHYQRILSGRIAALDVSYGLPTFFLNSLIVGAATTLLSVALSTLAGYALVRLRFAGWRIISHLIMACYLVPGIALMLPVFVLAVRLGLNNSLTGTDSRAGRRESAAVDMDAESLLQGAARRKSTRLPSSTAAAGCAWSSGSSCPWRSPASWWSASTAFWAPGMPLPSRR